MSNAVPFKWIFTLGLSVSSAVDIIITGLLFYLFRDTKPETGQYAWPQTFAKHR
jgi:hypothetical protein